MYRLIPSGQALARALYARKRLAVFDDVFSGLDKVTEQAVFTRVFSRTGLLRQTGTTIILATHSGTMCMRGNKAYCPHI